MKQRTIDDYAKRPSVAEEKLEDARNRERVTTNIGRHIKGFMLERRGRTFHLADVEAFVAERASGPVASGSVSRIMRHLRQAGEIHYELVSRRDSLYREVTP